jgi:thiol-disulfide isomerase/thioredoxin
MALVVLQSACAAIVPDVRGLANKGSFPEAEKLLQSHAAAQGRTPEWLEAYSWLGRGALNNKLYDKALEYAAETREMCLAELKKRPMDQEPRLPIAYGAAIEVQAQALAATGKRSEAVALLNAEVKTYGKTSIYTRLQKNVNLLTLEGRPAPAVAAAKWAYMGKPALVFLWAHWCGDCKQQAPILAKLREEFKNLQVIAPTKLYGYAARGEDATPDVERKWIDSVLEQHYSVLKGMPVFVDADTFARYGSSTTPTLVLVDAKGVVRMYHPGKMTHEELTAKIREMGGAVRSSE